MSNKLLYCLYGGSACAIIGTPYFMGKKSAKILAEGEIQSPEKKIYEIKEALTNLQLVKDLSEDQAGLLKALSSGVEIVNLLDHRIPIKIYLGSAKRVHGYCGEGGCPCVEETHSFIDIAETCNYVSEAIMKELLKVLRREYDGRIKRYEERY